MYGWSWRFDSDRREVLCAHCDKHRKMRENPPKPMSRKPTERLKEARDEDLGVNNQIWATRPHRCIECGDPLNDPPVKTYFSHLLPKGHYPQLRHDPANIVLHCPGCHNLWEFGTGRGETATYGLHIAYMRENGYSK